MQMCTRSIIINSLSISWIVSRLFCAKLYFLNIAFHWKCYFIEKGHRIYFKRLFNYWICCSFVFKYDIDVLTNFSNDIQSSYLSDANAHAHKIIFYLVWWKKSQLSHSMKSMDFWMNIIPCQNIFIVEIKLKTIDCANIMHEKKQTLPNAN